jgi:hypothetical protein
MENTYENCNGCWSFYNFIECGVQSEYKNFKSICPCGKCLIKMKCDTPCDLYKIATDGTSGIRNRLFYKLKG